MLLRCTHKLLAIIGTGQLCQPPPPADADDWYANLLWFDSRTCLLLTHAGTLFTIFEPDVRAPELRGTSALIVRLIERELLAENLVADAFGPLDAEQVRIGKTADRSVLGCMNDMAYLCEHLIGTDRGLKHTDTDALNRSLRRNINSARGYRRPIELTRDRIGNQPNSARQAERPLPARV